MPIVEVLVGRAAPQGTERQGVPGDVVGCRAAWHDGYTCVCWNGTYVYSWNGDSRDGDAAGWISA